MRGFADTAYVHAKVCALRSRLLSRSDYRRLLAGDSFERLYPGLSSSPGADGGTRLKELLFRRSIGGVLALVEARASYRDLFTAFLRLFESRNVKLLLARILGPAPSGGQWYDISPCGTFRRGDLDTLRDWNDLRRRLQGTYLERLCTLRGRPRFEALEGMADLAVLESFAAAARCLPARDRAVVQESVLMRAAFLSVLWQWRLERYYGWPHPKARDHFQSAARWQGLLAGLPAGGRPRLFIRSLQRRLAGDRADQASDGMAGPRLEHYAERRLYAYARGLAAGDFHSLACVAGYLWLLHYEIHNLSAVVDGIRFGIPAGSLEELLICGE